ncbi:MAG: GTP-binding protein [Pseudomonadota bacterium]
MSDDPRVPVTLLTGFLGAGKTTFLNAVLSGPGAGRIAVVVNEFGEAGLDHDLIETSKDDIVLMQSGCLCCSVRGDLSQTLERLLAKRDTGALGFDRVVIETTGLADPGPILQTLLVDQYLARTTRMDGVVTIADAANGPATLDAQFEAVSQIAMADLIILSKTDLVPLEAAQGFTTRLKAINPGVRVLPSVRGRGAADEIWGLSGLRHGAKPADVMAWTGVKAEPNDPLANLSGLTPTAPAQTQSRTQFLPHDARIGSASIVLDDPVPDAVFDRWLETLVLLRGPDLLRVKGVVFLEGIETPFVFHGVQDIFDPPVPMRDWPAQDRRSRIVVIARDITRPELRRSLDMLRARFSRPSAQRREEESIVP